MLSYDINLPLSFNMKVPVQNLKLLKDILLLNDITAVMTL
jgi:hypothetical protein